MIPIEPVLDVQLEHGAYFLAVAASGHIAAIDSKGQGSLLDPSATVCSRFQLCDQTMGLESNGRRSQVDSRRAGHRTRSPE